MAYAENTLVPVERSRAEIEKLLQRHKCNRFGTAVDYENHKALVTFTAHNRMIRFEVQLPDPEDRVYQKDRNGWQLSPSGIQKRVEQAERSRWRALLLVIKAKLESVESNIASFEEEFMAHIVLPNNQTVGQTVLPQIASIYETGRMPNDRLIGSGEPAVEIEAAMVETIEAVK